MQTTIRASVWDTKRWHFTSPAALRVCLEEYTEYQMAQGAPSSGGDMVPQGAQRMDRIFAQNRAIDQAMPILSRENHLSRDLLHAFYRMDLWNQFRGWHQVARQILHWDLPQCPGPVRCLAGTDERRDLKACPVGAGCDSRKRAFYAILDEAVEDLYAVASAAGDTVDTHSVQC